MKRSIYIPLFAFFLFTGVACEKGQNCESCKKVTYEDQQKVDEGPSQEYCGEALQDKKEHSASVGNRTEEYECS